MKRFLRSKLVLSIAALLMIAIAVIIPLSTNIRHSYAASSAASTIDLDVLSIESLVRPLCAGTSPTFQAFIRNNGSAASGFFDIRWNADGQIFDGGHFSIPAGAIDTHGHTWQNLTLGQHTLTFIANFDRLINETNYNNNQVTITFTVDNCASADVALLAPFNNGVTFTASQGYYNNQGTCKIGIAPDHCDNQLFGLDLVPDQSDNGQILAPVGGVVDFLPYSSKKAGNCMGLVLDDGIHLNICHFNANSLGTLKTGDRVTRGKVLGTRSTPHVHISLDDRRYGTPYLPVPFNGTHTLEGMSLNPNHNNTDTPVNYAKHWFLVEIEEWQGLTGVSSNVAIP